RQTSDQSQFVQWVFQRALARSATAAELQRAIQFLDQQRELAHKERRPASRLALPIPSPQGIDPYFSAAYSDLCLVVFNLNEFIYVD
ncbi:MAG: hypothetical protein VB857_12305, partial [Pirellulaceae bacterium]